MSVHLADSLVFISAAACGAGMLAWLVVFGRLEGEGVERGGEWFFGAVVAVCTLAAFASGGKSLWSVDPRLVVIAPAPMIGAVLLASTLTRRWKSPRQRQPSVSSKRRLLEAGVVLIAAYLLHLIVVIVGGFITDDGNW